MLISQLCRYLSFVTVLHITGYAFKQFDNVDTSVQFNTHIFVLITMCDYKQTVPKTTIENKIVVSK